MPQASGRCLSLSLLDTEIASWVFIFSAFNVFVGGVLGAAVASVSVLRAEYLACMVCCLFWMELQSWMSPRHLLCTSCTLQVRVLANQGPSLLWDVVGVSEP